MPGRRQVFFFFTNYKLMYTNGTAILYQTKRSQPTRRHRGGRRRPDGPRGGTAGHQQPPPPRHHRQRAGRAPVQQPPGTVTGVTSALVSSFRTPVIAHTRHQPTIIASLSGVGFSRGLGRHRSRRRRRAMYHAPAAARKPHTMSPPPRRPATQQPPPDAVQHRYPRR